MELVLVSPLDDPNSKKVQTIDAIDLVMTMIFTLELCLKVVTKGFYWASKEAYIRDPWNILDFTIVMCALLDLVLRDKVDVGFLKSLRTVRLLRPLRLITRNKALKVALASLLASMPNISRLMLMVLFYISLLAVLQTALLSG